MAKRKNQLWGGMSGDKTIDRPQKTFVAKGWAVKPDQVPAKKEAPRRRKYAPIKPNNRAAVALPMAGQSYNPMDGDHQKAIKKVVRKLERRKKADERVVAMLVVGRDQKTGGSLLHDKTWEEEAVKEIKPAKEKRPKTAEQAKKETVEKRKREKRARKLGNKKGKMDARRAMKHRRHPSRDGVSKELDTLDDIIEEHEIRMAVSDTRQEGRREARRENLTTKHFGRYHHTPLVEDVAPTSKLVGSLRHLSGGYVHPALDRMKSLEERNLVPARMRHTFNKRNILKPKGELKLKTETFGVLPYTSF